MASMKPDPLELLGATDVYLIDQILKGRVQQGARILDAGCGSGRNLPWFLGSGGAFRVTAVDPDAKALASMRDRFRELGVREPEEIIHASIERARLEPESFDLVINNAVLHFAAGHDDFERMLRATWRAVAPGGLMFVRLASSIGIEDRIVRLDEGESRYALPDGSARYLVDEAGVLRWTQELGDEGGAELADPIKTTIVQGLRAMTTWVVSRPSRP